MQSIRAIVIPDLHIPLHDVAAVNCVLRAIPIVKPDIAIFLGDIGEWDSVSHWKWKKKKRPPFEYIELGIIDDITQVDKVFALFTAALTGCDIHVIEGNHDRWLDYFYEENKCTGNEKYRFADVMKFKERGIDFYPLGKYLTIGELSFYHGDYYTTTNHARQHALQMGTNIMYAHTHDVQRCTVGSLASYHSAFCIGSLKLRAHDLNPWRRGACNWSSAFAVVDWFKNGNFRADIIDITDGETSVWGQHIDGKKKIPKTGKHNKG